MKHCGWSSDRKPSGIGDGMESLKKHISLGLDSSEVFVLGVKNAAFLKNINDREKLFGKMTVLEHPRYIQQYKSKEKKLFIDKYLLAFENKKL